MWNWNLTMDDDLDRVRRIPMRIPQTLRIEDVDFFSQLLSSLCVEKEFNFWMRTSIRFLQARRCIEHIVFVFLTWKSVLENCVSWLSTMISSTQRSLNLGRRWPTSTASSFDKYLMNLNYITMKTDQVHRTNNYSSIRSSDVYSRWNLATSFTRKNFS